MAIKINLSDPVSIAFERWFTSVYGEGRLNIHVIEHRYNDYSTEQAFEKFKAGWDARDQLKEQIPEIKPEHKEVIIDGRHYNIDTIKKQLKIDRLRPLD